MKTRKLSFIAVMMLSMTTLMAQSEKKVSFEVSGNCGMCEKRIEAAAQAVDGVSAADWNKETKVIEVTFDGSKTDKSKIQEAIAKVGHDTGKYKAEDAVYSKLPGCCKYDRNAEQKEHDHAGHSHSM